jgi:hypothetical protein
VASAARACTPGPWQARPAASAGAAPSVTAPQSRALLHHHLVLGHLWRRRGPGLEHLPSLRPGHRRVRQVRAAEATRRRPALHPLIRVRRPPQRRRLRARLPAGSAPRPAAQRPVLRLLLIRAVGGRRLRRRGGVLAQAALQVRDPLGQHVDLRLRRRQLRVLGPDRLAQPRIGLAQRRHQRAAPPAQHRAVAPRAHSQSLTKIQPTRRATSRSQLALAPPTFASSARSGLVVGRVSVTVAYETPPAG